ncbi:MAG: hypothetical protein GY717_11460 [Rhodobacteraceae bacterium]|nr:hypothetical protein [Paracoccaceae bacterium]
MIDPSTPHPFAKFVANLARVWSGARDDPYPTITGTIAITLRTMARAGSVEEAQTMAHDIWASRDRGGLPAAA